MNPTAPFAFALSGYTLRPLLDSDIPALQRLYEACADFVLLVEGTPVSPTAAEETFRDGPPGRSLEDKFLYGLFDGQGEMAAVLEGTRRYPDEGTWWIGLLMLAPVVRGQGLGRRLVDSFAGYAAGQGAAALMLGVVEENLAALAFWQRMGFTIQSKTEPRPFGQKLQCVYRLRRRLTRAPAWRKRAFRIVNGSLKMRPGVHR
jgi:GNAT superfamily N-acetyltransferase